MRCRQATSHYLSQCWPSSMSPYGVTMPQWVKKMMMINKYRFVISLVYRSTDRHGYVYSTLLLTKYSITNTQPSKIEYWSDIPLSFVYHYAYFLFHSALYILFSIQYPHSCVALIFGGYFACLTIGLFSSIRNNWIQLTCEARGLTSNTRRVHYLLVTLYTCKFWKHS